MRHIAAGCYSPQVAVFQNDPNRRTVKNVPRDNRNDNELGAPRMLFDNFVAIRRGRKRLVQASFDALCLLACFPLAMFLRLERISFIYDPQVWLTIALILPIPIGLFVVMGIYRPILRYISAATFMRIVGAGAIAAIAMFLLSQAATLPIPRSVPFIWFVLSMGGIVASRYVARSIVARFTNRSMAPVLIWGGGELARELVSVIFQGDEFRPVGMIDDHPDSNGEEVFGVRVYRPEDVPALMENLPVRHVLVALESATGEVRQAIVDRFADYDVEICTVPSVADIVSGRASINQVRALKIEDLLGREPVSPDTELLFKTVRDRVVLVTGAGGSIGAELSRQIVDGSPAKLILLDISEYALYEIDMDLAARCPPGADFEIIPVLGSVNDEQFMRRLLQRHAVDTVYHAAAYKHVPLVEENVISAVQNNVFGTRAVARAAMEANVTSFTLVSTDKAVRPTNVMGATKRVAEMYCQSLVEKSGNMTISMVRFGNVLGSSGSVIPRFRRQVQSGGPVTVTDPQITRYFMTIPEAAQLVVQAAGLAKGGDTFLLDMGAPLRIVDLAARMIRLSGSAPFVRDAEVAEGLDLPTEGEIEIVFTKLRPGEKLFEELLINENARKTRHPRIMRADETKLSPFETEALLNKLAGLCEVADEAGIRAALINCGPVGYSPRLPSAPIESTATAEEKKRAKKGKLIAAE